MSKRTPTIFGIAITVPTLVAGFIGHVADPRSYDEASESAKAYFVAREGIDPNTSDFFFTRTLGCDWHSLTGMRYLIFSREKPDAPMNSISGLLCWHHGSWHVWTIKRD